MGILGGGGGSANFDRLLESATSQLQLEPNWAHILEICDSIRQKDVTAKYAVAAIRRKMSDKNPHICKFALVTLEACMKNCGEPVHEEVATRDFLEELQTILRSGSDPVKEQILSMVQTWNQTLGKKSSYKVIQDTYNIMKAEGYKFPQLNESEAMYLAETAPEWAEGDVCHQCRVKFTTFTRQHHCRCCGQVFCAKCSSKNSIIPKYGIEREVRVCDACYDSINPSSGKKQGYGISDTQSMDSDELPAEYLNSSLAKEAQTKPQPSEAEIKAQEEEELQLAMALSLSAAESEKQQQPTRNWASSQPDTSYSSPASSSLYSEPKSNLYTDVVADSKRVSNSSDFELSHYLNREYWEKKKEGRSTEPSAPGVHEVEEVTARGSSYTHSDDEEENEHEAENSDAFVNTFSNSIQMFISRIQSIQSKGKHIAMDSTVQSLFQSLSAMHPQLMKLIEDEEDNKAKYQSMLEKIALVREARESLDGMRNQHREKLNQQELEQEMLRRMQMEQKLELMRQQKQEYLEYQRQLQIQRQRDIEQQQQLKLQPKQYQYTDRAQSQYGYQQRVEYETDTYRNTAAHQALSQDQPVSSVNMQYQQPSQYPQPAGYGQHPGLQPQPGPGVQSQPVQGVQPQPGPGVQPQPGPGVQSQPGPGVQSQPGPGVQTQSGPGMQSQPGPGAQPQSAPGRQPQSGGPGPQSQPAIQPGQPGYVPQGHIQPAMGQQPQQPRHPQQTPQSQAQVQPNVTQPQQQQQQQYSTKAPDLLDAPIGAELGAQQIDSQPQGYNNNQFQQRQQQPKYSPQEMQFQRISPQHQAYQNIPQNAPPQQHPTMPYSQQESSMNRPQDGGLQQRPPNNMQQPGSMQQPQGHMPHHPVSSQSSVPQQSYPQAGLNTSQAGNQPSYQGQTAQQLYQEPYTNQMPNQYPQPRIQQGPASMPYTGQHTAQNYPGPASLPANINQYANGNQGYATDMGYSQSQQQSGYMQQQQTVNPEPRLTEGMKDLQLISFE